MGTKMNHIAKRREGKEGVKWHHEGQVEIRTHIMEISSLLVHFPSLQYKKQKKE